MKLTSIFLQAFVLFFPFTVFSQQIIIKESFENTRDYLHEFFRPVQGRYVAVNYAAPHGVFSMNRNTKHTGITGYDANLSETYSMSLKPLSGNKYQGGIDIDKKLHIFYSDNKKVFRCELNPATGEVNGEPVNIFTATNEPDGFFKGFSPDSSYCYAIFKCSPSKGKDEIFEGVVMDRKLNVVSRFSFQLEKVKASINNTTCALSSEGILFVINSVRVKSSKDNYKPLQYLVTEVNKEGKSVTTLLEDLPEGRIDNLVWHIRNNKLLFTGLLSRSEKETFSVLLSGEYNSWQKKAVILKQVELENASNWQQTSGKFLLKGTTTRIPANAALLHGSVSEDGSTTLVVQKTDIRYTVRGNSGFTDSRGGFLYIIKTQPDGEISWLQVIPLSQVEPTYPLFSGAIAIQKSQKGLFIFFHDHIKNTLDKDKDLHSVSLSGDRNSNAELIAVNIKEDGSVTRKPAARNLDPDHLLAPHEPFVVYENEIIYTAYHSRNLGKSTYRIGSIRIK